MIKNINLKVNQAIKSTETKDMMISQYSYFWNPYFGIEHTVAQFQSCNEGIY